MTKDKRGQQIHKAIAERDAAALRRLAAAADREEGRMWLVLLARMMELDAGRRRRRRPVRQARVLTLPATRRSGLKRAI